eukprot:2394684-Pleurochrysis_carterae.AAC.3
MRACARACARVCVRACVGVPTLRTNALISAASWRRSSSNESESRESCNWWRTQSRAAQNMVREEAGGAEGGEKSDWRRAGIPRRVICSRRNGEVDKTGTCKVTMTES